MSFVGADGIWRQSFQDGQPSQRRPALFLDRDGVLIVDHGYVAEVCNTHVIDDAAPLIAESKRAGWAVVVVTNQSGVGRSYFSWEQFEAVQTQLITELEGLNGLAHGGIDYVTACPFHKDAHPPYQAKDHFYRKPNPGMLLDAADCLNIKLEESWIVGDRDSDIQAGIKAGIRGGIIIGPDAHRKRDHDVISEKSFSFHAVSALTSADSILHAYKRERAPNPNLTPATQVY